MAKLYISEYSLSSRNLTLPIAVEPSTATQVVDFSGGATQSATFSPRTNYVRIWADASCCVAFGSEPTATTDSMPMAANAAEYFGIGPGAKLSVIASS